MLLSYAWNNNLVFPGQERMAADIGSSQPTIARAIKELQLAGWLEIERRGQGKTNIYVLKYRVTPR
jgi:DNA-binding GntR family transcriptional regulator